MISPLCPVHVPDPLLSIVQLLTAVFEKVEALPDACGLEATGHQDFKQIQSSGHGGLCQGELEALIGELAKRARAARDPIVTRAQGVFREPPPADARPRVRGHGTADRFGSVRGDVQEPD